MELFRDVISGPYLFLLIAQILIVAGLALAFLWLLLERVREASSQALTTAPPEQADLPVAPSPVNEKQNESQAPVSEDEPLPVPEPEPEDSAVAAEMEPAIETPPPSTTQSPVVDEPQIQALTTESLELKDKIKYLESRLMEYEIVQEEISALSALRVENEKLKAELVALQGGGAVTPNDPTAGANEPTSLSDAPSAEPAPQAQRSEDLTGLLSDIDALSPKPD